MHLKPKLITLFLVITAIPIIFIGSLSYTNAKDALLKSRTDEMEVIVDLKVEKIETFFNSLKAEVEINQDSFAIKTFLPVIAERYKNGRDTEYLKAKSTLDNRFAVYLRVKKEIMDMMLLDPEGTIVYALAPKHAEHEIGKKLFLPKMAFEKAKNGLYISEIFSRGNSDNGYEMIFASPMRDLTKHFIGLLVFEINMDPIYDFIQESTGLGESGETLIAQKRSGQAPDGREGEYVLYLNPLRHDPVAALKRFIFYGVGKTVPAQMAARGESGSGTATDYRGKEVLAAWRYLPSLNWGLVAKIDMQEVLAPVIALRSSILTICLIVLGMAGLIGYVLADSIAKPLHELHKGTEIIGSGNLDFKVGTDVNDEIGQLSRAFDQMTDNLKNVIASMRKVEELDRLKSMFIASMSHELRTPLNSIIGFTGILLMGMAGELNEEQRKQLSMVKSSAGHLLNLINDVIDVSKIEAEKIQLDVKEFDLSRVVKEVEDSFTVAVEEKGLKLSVDMPDKTMIKSDERRVKQIIMNLVSNAIKFTEKGEIAIRVMGNGERVSISIKDTGMGVRTEDMSKLFKQFSRIIVEGQPLQEGTGLGLYLSQKLARVLGGEIKAESEFGRGSEFTFTLPLEYKEG